MSKKTITPKKKELRKQLKKVAEVRRACELFERSGKTSCVSTYVSPGYFWYIYTQFQGYINEKYFRVCFQISKQFDTVGEIEVASNTDCRTEVFEILKDYSHLIKES